MSKKIDVGMVKSNNIGCAALIASVIIVVGINAFALGWVLMLFMGVLHLEVSESVPNLGYGACVAIIALVTLLFGGIGRNG